MEELWIPISGYEGLYEISSCGRVRSLDRTCRSKGGSYAVRRGRMMKFSIDADGYYGVGLTKDGKQTAFRVNRLVAQAFLPNPLQLPIVHHKDNNKQNNAVSNLEWVTVSTNTKHAVNSGRLVVDSVRMAAISPLGVEKTRKPVRCVETGVEFSTITDCCRYLNTDSTRLLRYIINDEPLHGNRYEFCREQDRLWGESVRHKYPPLAKERSRCFHPVRCDTTGQVFNSRKAAGAALGVSPDGITSSIKHSKSIKGLRFSEVVNDEEGSEQ